MTSTENREEKDQLVEFLDALRDTLGVAFFMHAELFGSHAGRFQSEWPKNQQRFNIVRGLFETDPRLRSDDSDESLNAEDAQQLDRRLRDHGLTGDELALKLDIFYSVLRDFLDEIDHRDAAVDSLKRWAARVDRPEPTGGLLRGALGHRIRSALGATRRVLTHGLRQVLGAGDMVFDSVSDVVSFIPGPKAAAAAIKETKEAAEIVLTRPDEADRPPKSTRTTWEPIGQHDSLRNRIAGWFSRRQA